MKTTESAFLSEQPIEISKRSRISLWLIAWVVALAFNPILWGGLTDWRLMPIFVRLVWAFPFGLIAFVLPGRGAVSEEFLVPLSMVGWVFYAALSAIGLAQQRLTRFIFVYGVLCVLLILNVVGCNVNKFGETRVLN